MAKKTTLKLGADDFLLDEAVRECSPGAVGVLVMTMCLLQKQPTPGTMVLKDVVTENQTGAFALRLSKILPWDLESIERYLWELEGLGLLEIGGGKLVQPMLEWNAELAEKRKEAGRKGGRQKAKNREAAENPGQPFEAAEVPERTDDELGRLIAAVEGCLGTIPNGLVVEELKNFKMYMDKEVILHAIGYATDQNKKNWRYIKTILLSYKQQGIRNMRDVEESELDFAERKRKAAAEKKSGGLHWNTSYSMDEEAPDSL